MVRNVKSENINTGKQEDVNCAKTHESMPDWHTFQVFTIIWAMKQAKYTNSIAHLIELHKQLVENHILLHPIRRHAAFRGLSRY